jgi:hypothetical protein
VVLNLHHPDIVKLVNLCETVPNLAGHFATAMCLSTQGRNTILQHIAPETREELIYLDAVCRCGRGDTPINAARDEKPDGASDQMNFKDFLRHVTESDFKF